jgi:hypothetical protein
MVCYGCVGCCWLLEADVSSTNCRNSKNCLRKYLFHSYVDPIHSGHLTHWLNKEDLDLHIWNISWFLCPVFNNNPPSLLVVVDGRLQGGAEEKNGSFFVIN